MQEVCKAPEMCYPFLFLTTACGILKAVIHTPFTVEQRHSKVRNSSLVVELGLELGWFVSGAPRDQEVLRTDILTNQRRPNIGKNIFC